MAEVEGLAGAGHFRTGIAGSVHFTVRVLERYREAVGRATRWSAGMPRPCAARPDTSSQFGWIWSDSR